MTCTNDIVGAIGSIAQNQQYNDLSTSQYYYKKPSESNNFSAISINKK